MPFVSELTSYHSTPPITRLIFFINRKLHCLERPDPKLTTLAYLRKQGLTGTKLGCGEGGCGACTVVIASLNENIKFGAARTGSWFAVWILHPRYGHMSMYGLLQNTKEPTIQDIEDSFEGNRAASEEPEDKHCNIVYSHNSINADASSMKPKVVAACSISELAAKAPYLSEQDVPFPRDLLEKMVSLSSEFLYFEREGCEWFRPIQLQQLLELKAQHPGGELVGGGTKFGIEMRVRSSNYRCFIDVSGIAELRQVTWGEDAMTIGPNLTITDFICSLEAQLPLVKSHQRTTLKAFLTNLRWFAGAQIRNVATVGGNLATGSPASDLSPLLIATQAVLTLTSQGGTRRLTMSDFFKGYHETALNQDEVILSIKVPLARKGQFVRAYKQARRKEMDSAIVNAAFCVQLDMNSQPTIVSLELSYGGLGPTPVRLTAAPKKAYGLQWGHPANLEKITDAVLNELALPYSMVGGMPSYRRALAVSFFKRFWYQLARDLSLECDVSFQNLDGIERGPTQATQTFGPSANHHAEDQLISRTYPHLSALAHCTGTAKYLDDLPAIATQLHAAPVFSTHAHAEILAVDPSSALALAGVHHFINHADVPGQNAWGVLVQDEELFATKEVHCVGQLIGLVLADSHELARRAAQLVRVRYKPLDFLLTIQDAINANSFFPFERKLTKGDFSEEAFTEDGVIVVSGECYVGGCLAIPKGENGEMELLCSSQNLAESQMQAALALRLPANRITARAKRLGGGFGGKETRASVVAVAAAVAAHASGRPVRYILDRDMDMLSSGNRHPCYAKYRLAITRDGRFRALDLELVANAGWCNDVSHAVLERAVTHCDNVYHFPILRVVGRLAKTNVSTNTAFRGFGGPQAMMVTEMMIAAAADTLGMDPAALRRLNFYEEGQLTHYKMPILDWHLPEMWDSLLADAKYLQRLAEIDAFNASNPWRKRGIVAIPTKFAISFNVHYLNQAGATVLIYTDGSVLLSHGGVDMGQGLHTKMVQLCANALRVPLHSVHVAETCTDKVANASPTASSSSSDLNGMAVLDACRQLNERLQPYWDRAPPDATLAQVAMAAYLDMVNLGASGFYRAPTTPFDWERGEGTMFLYTTTGVAVTEVEVDVLTGDHVVRAADLLMDVGNSINFAIDLGQIEGAFVQGMGWCTTEETLFASETGRRIGLGPGTYKIPGFRSIPQKFNVNILPGRAYHHLPTVKSSKGIGEPLCSWGPLSCLPYIDTPLSLPSPATAEIIRLACEDKLARCAQIFPSHPAEKPWAVCT
ncbi:hypothetical protein L0F63_003442 [Massospora cicadina]|nr:hypothetical protein L0F63_003442 [Massospora cicadina]